MEFKQLEAINKKLATVDIKGKEYVQVNARVLAFRELYPNGAITTDIVSLEGERVVIKATIYDENGKVLGTGLAYEKESSSFINKTSFIENCETSAVGRALGFVGIGIDGSICSAEEVGNAIKQQNTKNETKKYPRENVPFKPIDRAQVDTLEGYGKSLNDCAKWINAKYGTSFIGDDLSFDDLEEVLKYLKNKETK